MRIIFFFLLIINLLFGVWQYLYPRQSDAAISDLPVNIDTIHLMRDRLAGDNDVAPAVFLCHTIGPFEDNQLIDVLKQQLQQYTKRLNVREIAENEPYRYWVYIHAQNSAEAAEISKSLASRKVSDYYVMTSSGEIRVSLGRFKEKTYAEKRQKQIAAAGFAVKSEVIYRNYQLYWLDYDLSEERKDDVNELILPYLHDEVSLLNRECEK